MLYIQNRASHIVLSTIADFVFAGMSKTKVSLNTDFNGNNSFKLK